MAVAYIQEFPIGDRSTTNYDFVADKIGDGPFDGLIVHTAGFDGEAGVFRILDVWETREHAPFASSLTAQTAVSVVTKRWSRSRPPKAKLTAPRSSISSICSPLRSKTCTPLNAEA